MPKALPDFKEPPLQEVALSVQFAPLERLSVPHVGLLWDRFRERFPKTEEHHRIEPAIERFESVQKREPLRFRFSQKYPRPRVWFVNDSETKVLQIQEDRFIFNWRRRITDKEYPRYPILREDFLHSFRTFQEFVSLHSLGDLELLQSEVIYVNVIKASEATISNTLTVFRDSYSEPFLPVIEAGHLSFSYVILLEDKPCGRLHVQTDAVPGSDVRLVLTARGSLVGGEGVEGVSGFFDLGHEWIVRGFAAITSGRLHKKWGRTDERTA